MITQNKKNCSFNKPSSSWSTQSFVCHDRWWEGDLSALQVGVWRGYRTRGLCGSHCKLQAVLDQGYGTTYGNVPCKHLKQKLEPDFRWHVLDLPNLGMILWLFYLPCKRSFQRASAETTQGFFMPLPSCNTIGLKPQELPGGLWHQPHSLRAGRDQRKWQTAPPG